MKKIIDERGRLFGLISVIDVVVIVVVVVLTAAVYAKFNVIETPLTVSGTVPVTYTVSIPIIRESNARLLRAGDKLYTDTGTFIGMIKDVKIEQGEVTDSLVDGSFATVKVEGRHNVTLTVEADCSASNGRYYANRTFELNANAEQSLTTKYNEFSGIITSITAG